MKAVVKFLLALLAFFAIVTQTQAADDTKGQECEVCIGLVKRFEQKVKEDKLKTPEAVEAMMVAECKVAKHPREQRLCWYIGASSTSATNILREISKPLLLGMPSEAICPRRLKQKDSAICALRYEGSSVVDDSAADQAAASKPKKPKKPKAPKKLDIDWAGLPKLKIRALRDLLKKHQLDCEGCTEKSDFISKLRTLQPKDEL